MSSIAILIMRRGIIEGKIDTNPNTNPDINPGTNPGTNLEGVNKTQAPWLTGLWVGLLRQY
jgi:hypothetical protein